MWDRFVFSFFKCIKDLLQMRNNDYWITEGFLSSLLIQCQVKKNNKTKRYFGYRICPLPLWVSQSHSFQVPWRVPWPTVSMAVMLSKDRYGASAPLLAYSWLPMGGPVWVSCKIKHLCQKPLQDKRRKWKVMAVWERGSCLHQAVGCPYKIAHTSRDLSLWIDNGNLVSLKMRDRRKFQAEETICAKALKFKRAQYSGKAEELSISRMLRSNEWWSWIGRQG